MEWKRIRHPETTEVYHELTLDDGTVVAKVDRPTYRYRAQVLDHVPFETASLKIAKSAAATIYSKQINKE